MINTDEPHPTPRPEDPFTSRDGARLFTELSRELAKLNNLITTNNGTLANILNKEIQLLEQMNRIEAGLSGSRINRFEQELREAELERDRVLKSLETAEERLKLKAAAKDTQVNTQERLEMLANKAYEKLEEERRSEGEAFRRDLSRGALKSIVNGLAFSGALAVLGFIWFLIQLYLNRGGGP